MTSATYIQARAYAAQRGLVRLPGQDSKGHEVWVNDQTGARVSLSTTMNARNRSLQNAYAAIDRAVGLDGRGLPPREGARRKRRLRARLGSGFNLDAAKREALRHDGETVSDGQRLDALLAEKEQLIARLYAKRDQGDSRDHEAEHIAGRVADIEALISQLRRTA